MKHELDFDIFVDQAVSDAYGRYTLCEYNLDRVAGLAAHDLIKNWGPELAEVFKTAILKEMEGFWNSYQAGRSSTATSD